MAATLMQDWFLLDQSLAIPLSQRRGRVISALSEFEQRVIWGFRSANRVVRQNEFLDLRIIGRGVRFHFRFRKTFWFRVRVGIKNRLWYGIVTRPKSEATNFLRIRFARDRVRQMRNSARMRRRLPTGKSRYRQIETAPEKMDRTAFAAETRAKFFKDAIGLSQHAPEAIRVLGIVGTMLLVFVERNRIGNFVRQHVDLHR